MDAWRQKREIARREFASELRGDLSQEEEQLLQARLTSQKAALAALRLEHEKLQKEANSLESAFVAVRQATGVNSLDEVVEKFLGQQGNRRALTTEKREAEERLGNAKRGKEEIENRFAELKASGIGSTEMNREIAEQLEREIAAARVELKASNAGCERLEGVLVALRQGAVGLYQRLRPFGHLLEGEGALPTAAMLPGGIAAGGGGGGGGAAAAGPDAPAIDSIDAIHLSEIMLSKMVEIISGGEHGAGTSGIMNLHEAASPSENDLEDDESATNEALPHPQNNIRVRSDAQQKEVDRQITNQQKSGSFFITEGAEGEAVAEDGVGLSVGLSDAAVAEALDDMVPSRTFLKLSSSRQHQEMIRRNEQDARKKRMLERIEMAEGAERAQMSSRAARKKAQTEANNRLSKMVKQGQPPPLSKTKDSAIERSMMFLKQVPELL